MSQVLRARDVVGVEDHHGSSLLHRRVRLGADAFDIREISQKCPVEESVQMESANRSPEADEARPDASGEQLKSCECSGGRRVSLIR